MKKQVIRLTESDLHKIIKESVNKIIKENYDIEGTDKQNALLRKLLGDRWRDEYENLSVQDASSMIEKELANANPNAQKYEVVDNMGDKPEIIVCNSFFQAKKTLEKIAYEYHDEGGFGRPDSDIQLVKVSDICYKVYGRYSRYKSLGSIFIRKQK
jgi:hypothetical protein